MRKWSSPQFFPRIILPEALGNVCSRSPSARPGDEVNTSCAASGMGLPLELLPSSSTVGSRGAGWRRADCPDACVLRTPRGLLLACVARSPASPALEMDFQGTVAHLTNR